MPTADEIRQQFLDFFAKKHGHTIVPSSPVVPHDDPTLLFTNAGMNQFKDVFLGAGTRPYKRAVDTQKCIRAGGKHNDLDDVGKDTYHHTFFEMLGNWSFGDYFKKEAIRWAWELLTEVWKLDKSRLHATVFEGDKDQGLARDDEAFEFWKTQTDIDPAHIHYGNKKDNFWEMGDTGPCGPCSEIHYDRTPDKSGGTLVNKGRPDMIEIWNLVFIQFNSIYPDTKGLELLRIWDFEPAKQKQLPFRSRDEIVAKYRTLEPLPAKHVDTGMGFERLTAVLQMKDSNYDTDVFKPILDAISVLVGRKYEGKLNTFSDEAFRVIADHIRLIAFAITDGALPDNKGRGAVLRSVLRRAFRFGYQYFGLREPFLHRLVPVLVDQMSEFYAELKENPARLQQVIRGEEADFLRTIERGIKYFEEEMEKVRYSGRLPRKIPYGSAALSSVDEEKRPHNRLVIVTGKFPGEAVFRLYTTFGFPPDLTRQMSTEKGLSIDEEGFERLMEEHRLISASDTFKATETAKINVEGETDDRLKWSMTEIAAQLGGYLAADQLIGSDSLFINTQGQKVTASRALMAERTCFYAESGGQVGDKGFVTTSNGVFEVLDTIKKGKIVFHLGNVLEGEIKGDELAKLQVSPLREFIRKNHTATHLLNWALRRVLGEHIDQRGSLVDPDKTRFDFTHGKALSPEEIAEVERLVNERIYADLPVTATILPLAEAKKIAGVRAVFGEKYPDPVRVLMIGVERPEDATPEHSVEFCGGTHLTHTGQAGFFKIISQEPVSKGVRRVTAVTGRKAVETVQALSAVVDDLAGKFNCKPEELPGRVAALQDEIKKLQQQLKKGAATDLQSAADKLLAAATEVGGAKVLVGEMPAGPPDAMRQQVDRLRQKTGSAVVVIGWPTEDGKVKLMAAVTDDLVTKGLHAGKLVGQIAKVVGGGGSGKPTMAEAGGKDPAKLGEALQLARKLAGELLTK